MASERVTNSVDRFARKVPGLRRVPVVVLIGVAEVILMTREHVAHLTPAERRRLITLVRIGRGRRSRLTEAQRRELAALLDKMEARGLVGDAVTRLSPVRLPRRLLYGRR